jgi:hypothetical protein
MFNKANYAKAIKILKVSMRINIHNTHIRSAIYNHLDAINSIINEYSSLSKYDQLINEMNKVSKLIQNINVQSNINLD